MQNKSITLLFKNINKLLTTSNQLNKMEEYIGKEVIDLLFYIPIKIIYHQICKKWEELEDKKNVIIKLHIEKHYNSYYIKNAPYRIKAIFCNKPIFLVFFSKRTGYLRKIFPENTFVIISGKLEVYNKKFQINHPSIFSSNINLENSKFLIKPVYKQKQGIKSDFIRKNICQLLEKVSSLEEWNNDLFNHFKNIPTWKEALISIHKPLEQNILDPKSNSFLRLAYDELLASQLALNLVRKNFNEKKGNKYIVLDESYLLSIIKSLPFKLTNDQTRILKEVIADLLKNQRMNRLIHGDVGTGKTILAFLAAYYVIKSKFQVAILVPTELLAKQHYDLALEIFRNFNVNTSILTSSSNNKKEILDKLANGNTDLVIGTHSIIQNSVIFKCLSLVIIDEQHRFGVEQRLKMREKGYNVDMLLLSATPIPRTLMLATLGDIDISTLKEKPNNNKITTIIKSEENINEIIDYLKILIELKKKIFWVCPMIDSDEELKTSNVYQRNNILKKIFKKTAILHGKMSTADKNIIIEKFKNGKVDILITTVVIEVGIDIPDANVIIIEKSETFGLAQIHQLRGRVGRGKEEGKCILLFGSTLTEISYQRLTIMKSTNDGFLIAEKDLEMRGGGEVLGARQYGYENFIFFDLTKHNKLLEIASNEANFILNQDPGLTTSRGLVLRNLLLIFKKNKVLDLISAG